MTKRCKEVNIEVKKGENKERKYGRKMAITGSPRVRKLVLVAISASLLSDAHFNSPTDDDSAHSAG